MTFSKLTRTAGATNNFINSKYIETDKNICTCAIQCHRNCPVWLGTYSYARQPCCYLLFPLVMTEHHVILQRFSVTILLTTDLTFKFLFSSMHSQMSFIISFGQKPFPAETAMVFIRVFMHGLVASQTLCIVEYSWAYGTSKTFPEQTHLKRKTN